MPRPPALLQRPHVRSLVERLWALIHRMAVLSNRGEDTREIEGRIKQTVERLERHGLTPIEIRAEEAGAIESARRLIDALTPNPSRKKVAAPDWAEPAELLGGFLYSAFHWLLGVKDVYVWEDPGGDLSAALVLTATKLNRLLGSDPESRGKLPVSGPQVADAIEYRGRRSSAGHKVSGDIFKWEPELYASDFLQRVPSALPQIPEFETVSVTFIPEPGYPWPADDNVYYSAKAKTWRRSEEPPWLLPDRIVDEARAIDSYGVDLCVIAGDMPPLDPEPFSLQFGGSDGESAIVTHSFGQWQAMDGTGKDRLAAAAASVASCGGFLFPSLAVGTVPSSNFGQFSLVLPASVALASVSGRSRPGTLYDTDVWTGGTAMFKVDAAISAFEQLHGHSEYMYTFDLNVWPLGSAQGTEVIRGPAEDADVIRSPRQLARVLRDRFRLWRRDIDFEKFMDFSEAMNKWRYPYLELKLRGILTTDQVIAVTVPAGQARLFRELFADETGLSAALIEVEAGDLVDRIQNGTLDHKERNWLIWQYSWLAKDAIYDWSWQHYGPSSGRTKFL